MGDLSSHTDAHTHTHTLTKSPELENKNHLHCEEKLLGAYNNHETCMQ